MPSHIRETTLFCSGTATLHDIRCRPHDLGCGDDESVVVPSIAFVRAGVFRKHLAREDHVADVNHVVFFNPEEPYRVSHPLHGGDDCTSIRFAEGVLREALWVLDRRSVDQGILRFPVQVLSVPSDAAFLLAALRRGLRNDGADGFAVEEACLALLDAITAALGQQHAAKPDRVGPATRIAHRTWTDRTRELLAAHYAEPLTLEDVARAVSCSPFHLVRVFRRHAGLPIHKYLNRLRLLLSLDRLAEGADDLTSLALDLGFSSHSHFSHAFRHEFKATPSAFRSGIPRQRLLQMSKNLKA